MARTLGVDRSTVHRAVASERSRNGQPAAINPAKPANRYDRFLDLWKSMTTEEREKVRELVLGVQ